MHMSRVKLLGYEIDDYTFNEALNRGSELLEEDRVSQVVTINPEMFDCAKVDTEFSDILKSAEMVIPDGVGVKIGLKILGHNVQRIAGVDYAKKMIGICADKNIPIALVGAKPEIVSKACENLKNEFSGLNIVYYRDGYFDNNEDVIKELSQCGARLILIALGSPKQEKFIKQAKQVYHLG